MKRKIEGSFLDSGPGTKHKKQEAEIFKKALFDRLGCAEPSEHFLKESCRVPSLKSICRDFNLAVGKSGRGLQPASLKADYVNAIIMQLLALGVELPRDSYMEDQLTVGISMDATPHGTVNEIDIGPAAPGKIKIRLYDYPQEYRTRYREEINFLYDVKHGIDLQEVSKHFRALIGDASVVVVHPISYKPFYVPQNRIDSCLVKLLKGNNDYLRVTAVL